jgi:hypothetical protein
MFDIKLDSFSKIVLIIGITVAIIGMAEDYFSQYKPRDCSVLCQPGTYVISCRTDGYECAPLTLPSVDAGKKIE